MPCVSPTDDAEGYDLFILLKGTKIEANANKYTFVWNKTIDNYDRKLDEKIKNYLCEIDFIVAEENEIYLDDDLGEISEKVGCITLTY